MNSAELVCADGGSVVLLGKLAGATRMQRVPTTDAGWDVLKAVGELLGRPTRIALVGAHQEVVTAAATTLVDGGAGDVVLVENGYHDDWTAVLERVREAAPDVLVLGLGAPKEMLWVRDHAPELPACLVMTCGGWFGFLSGTEARAPEFLRKPGLEWLARVGQAPTRLLPRYLRGMATTAVLAAGILVRRSRSWLASR
ncbi:MAG: WecB/TagA/CpsF family glycosyltransferase [Propionicimonas sp.]|uniref:WecB/TagA/CpsF family glycosyltransferase n=1 Tax=Propionicimonas sp. TaxID=1955623 RepID=UPI003D0F8609